MMLLIEFFGVFVTEPVSFRRESIMTKYRKECYVPILFLLQSFCVLSDRRIHHPSNNSRAALIIYTGSSSYELISTIRHFASHIPPEWIFQVFYANHTLLDPLKRLSSEFRHKFVLSRIHHTWESHLRNRDTLNAFFVKRVEFLLPSFVTTGGLAQAKFATHRVFSYGLCNK